MTTLLLLVMALLAGWLLWRGAVRRRDGSHDGTEHFSRAMDAISGARHGRGSWRARRRLRR